MKITIVIILACFMIMSAMVCILACADAEGRGARVAVMAFFIALLLGIADVFTLVYME